MSKQQIIVSARVGFVAVHQIADRMHGVDFPIELALPYRYDWWKEAVVQFDEMLDTLEKMPVEVVSVHATQAKITEEDVLRWGRQTIEIAERLGARTITVHPNQIKKNRSNLQELALTYLRQLQRRTSVTISVETFPGKRRVFQPEEIMKAKLPMTLDTAHIHDDDQIMNIINDYWQNIPVVHLSARGQNEHHLPIDSFCVQVVRKLVNLGWSGSIALEYLPWHHYRLESDIEIIKQALIRDIKPDEILPPCDAYKGQQDKWGHDAPEPDVTVLNFSDNDMEARLSELRECILCKHKETVKQLRTVFPDFEFLTEGEQATKYAAFIGKTTLSFFLHRARKGRLTLQYLWKKFKKPDEIAKFIKENHLALNNQ